LGSALFRAAVADVWQRRLTPIAAVAADELLLLALAARIAVLLASCREVLPTAAAVSMCKEEALCCKDRRSIKQPKGEKGSLLDVHVRQQQAISEERPTRGGRGRNQHDFIIIPSMAVVTEEPTMMRSPRS
jgi:hypothetical protein